MACRDMDFLCAQEEYYMDPSKSESSKNYPWSLDLRHKQKRELLCMDSWYNPPCVNENWKSSRSTGNKALRDGSPLRGNWQSSVAAVEEPNGQVRPCHTSKNQAGSWPLSFDELVRNEMFDGYMRDSGEIKVPKLKRHVRDRTSLLKLIKACGNEKDLHKGRKIHAAIRKISFLKKDIYIGTALLHMYTKCGALAEAKEVFDNLSTWDVASWNALISGFAQQGDADEALKCYRQMQDNDFPPDAVTFVCILKACGSIGAAEKGKEIHAEVLKQGLCGKNIIVSNALVDMYAKCGALAKAQELFDELGTRNVVTWNVLIAGYVQNGLDDEALKCFEHMKGEGISPNDSTLVSISRACGSVGAAKQGEGVHVEAVRQGLLERHVVLGTTLVDMYAKCGTLSKAQEVFDELPERDVISWNVLIAGYAQYELGHKALMCYRRMRGEGLSPDAFTFVCVLKACGSIGAVEKGEEIHAEVCEQQLLESNIVLGNALVDMYAKCGAPLKAQEVFDVLCVRDVVTWTALITGYAHLGKVRKVLYLFNRMIVENVKPDEVAFVVLLSACSHAGLVEEGQMHFDTMSTVHHIIPTLEHHTCMVDLFSRAGHFDKALRVIEKVPPLKSFGLWSALLGACRKWVNVEIGRQAFEHSMELDEKYAAAYVCMSNIYAAASMKEEADKIETLRRKNGAWGLPERCWWTDAHGNIHTFTSGDKNHAQSKDIQAKLKDISERLRLEGYVARMHWVSQALSDYGNEVVLCGHSEKLTIACALVNTSEGTPIRISKNVRICNDCHLATSLISKIEKRVIQVKDANRIHIFQDGKCICEEGW